MLFLAFRLNIEKLPNQRGNSVQNLSRVNVKTKKLKQLDLEDLKNDLKNNKSLVEKELNRDLDKNIRMATTISSIVIDGIYPMNNELLIQSSLIGELKILVK